MGQSLGTHLIWVIQHQKALMAYTASNHITQSKLCPRVYTLHSEHHQKKITFTKNNPSQLGKSRVSHRQSPILQVIIIYKSRLVNIEIIKRLTKFYKWIWLFLLKMWQFFVTNKKQSQNRAKITAEFRMTHALGGQDAPSDLFWWQFWWEVQRTKHSF